ncbi:uncharacterized protein MELLADRAFT_111080 [Melampsora larici-populina 98AG31]|uniref:Uncharacterized protein n=1 Tax=Melampsora larici-populina (strain 98AG31 / pathotype 3-4-7) TaxID=747676 RepID=F4S1Z4_MELLP|nr:uncharacterized protein MELLADRAFT_111080 [Melampsora larici-populina 98AG31]EGG01277.1 hypothetical protein MELLADRAFT_111080 [Melampsora larici-populina 98AG31]
MSKMQAKGSKIDFLAFKFLGEIKLLSVDKKLLQEDHLNAWRDLRTIDIVTRHNRNSSTYQKRVEDLANKMMKTTSDQRMNLHRDAVEWSEHKANKPLAIVMYYLIQLLKVHLPESTHEEIEFLPEDVKKHFKVTYFDNTSLSRNMIDPFMDASMPFLGWHLLMEWFNINHGIGLHSSVNQIQYEWKKTIPKVAQVGYASHYMCYMKLIEKIEVLASAAIQDINLIKKVDSKISFRSLKKFFGRNVSDVHILQKHLLNEPHDKTRPLKFPLFGIHFKIDGEISENIKADIIKSWKSFSADHVGIASELSKISRSTSKKGTTLPGKVRDMSGYRKIKGKTNKDNPQHNQMWRHIARTINLVTNLDPPKSSEKLILWQILRSVLTVIANKFEPTKFERQIENTVMFYLLIRRLGEVLEEAVKSQSSSNDPGIRCTRAQFMMYYWSTMCYSSTGLKNKQEKTNQRMQFELGRVYFNHLISSQRLNKLYDHMPKYSENSSKDYALEMDQEKETMVSQSTAMKEVIRHRHRMPEQSKNDHSTFGRNFVHSDYALEGQPHASKGLTSAETMITNSDRMNFEVPRKRSSRYPNSITSNKKLLVEHTTDHTSSQTSPQKRKPVEDTLMHSDRSVSIGVKKKQRTNKLVNSSLGSVSQWPTQIFAPMHPSTVEPQNTFHHKISSLKEPEAIQESNTGGKKIILGQIDVEGIGLGGYTSDIYHLNKPPLSSITPVPGPTLPQDGHIHLFDLNKPWEYTSCVEKFSSMLPDLNEPYEDLSVQ